MLKTDYPETPQGRRDRLLMCILLDLGLRAGEASALTVGGLDLTAETIRVNRKKVGKQQTHRLTEDILDILDLIIAAQELLPKPTDALIRRSYNDGRLGMQGMGPVTLSRRVHFIASQHGIEGLTAHDCRHFWATWAANQPDVDLFRLQEAGGWTDLKMPRRYTEAAEIANEGIPEALRKNNKRHIKND
jgi:integrase